MSTNLSVCRVAESGRDVPLDLAMVSRHGLVTGATGTGKTVTLQALAEAFSRSGVPVLCCDVKGDLSGIAAAGGGNPKIAGAFGRLGLPEPAYAANPTAFWDVFGALGLPLRATVSDLGPLLLGRLLGLKDIQADTLRLIFRIADERDLSLLDLKDVRAMLEWVSANAASLKSEYGLLSGSSLGAIQRSVLALDDTGAGHFFGEPALSIDDLMHVDSNGRGLVSVLASEGLMAEPTLYATVLLHLLGEVFEELPEAGDLDKPKLVLLLDEAHLLFDDTPKALVEAVERTARLVRSKGVGLWLVTQSPLDVPESVLGQLGNRIHHALRAYTPKDKKAVDSVADTLRPNPKLDAAAVITELGVGEALVSFLDAEGRPTPVEQVRVVPPASRIGAIDPPRRAAIIAASPFGLRYRLAIDRESAYEILKSRMRNDSGAAVDGISGASAGLSAIRKPDREPTIEEIEAELSGMTPTASTEPEAPKPAPRPAPRSRAREPKPAEDFASALAKAALSAASRELGRQAIRGILGTRRRR